MEHVEAMAEVEWNNLNGMYSSASSEEAAFMAQLLGTCSLPGGSNLADTTQCSWSVHESSMNMAANVHGTDLSSIFSSCNECENYDASINMHYYFSQASNSSGTSSGYHHQGYYHPTTSMSMMDHFVLENKNTNHYLMGGGGDDLNQDVSSEDIIMDYSNETKSSIDQFGLDEIVDLQLGRERDMEDMPKSLSPTELSTDVDKKRPRTLIVNVQKNKRVVKSKKNPKFSSSGDDEGEKNKASFQRQDSMLSYDEREKNKAFFQRQDSMLSYDEGEKNKGIYLRQDSMLSRTSIEADSNVSQEINEGTTSTPCPKGDGILNLSGKARAGRGAATDPQSLYARKRREKINERLKVLQTLVPNGTKVDISTMLEEAVQYVKFLQLQIKLLSSDDTWMYAPIAYNGMDIGLL